MSNPSLGMMDPLDQLASKPGRLPPWIGKQDEFSHLASSDCFPDALMIIMG
jgi:hypothetical protein